MIEEISEKMFLVDEEEMDGTSILHRIETERMQTVKRFEGQQRYILENM